MGIAHGGQIVCSGVVAELIEGHVELTDLGAHRLRDVESALRVFQILAPGLESQFPPLNSLDARRSNLPQEMGSFVGRVDDVTAVVKAFARGPSGVSRRHGWRGQDAAGVAGRLEVAAHLRGRRLVV